MQNCVQHFNLHCESKNCFAEAGFDPLLEVKMGHILSLSINGVELKSDTQTWDPENSKKTNVVAIIDYILWSGDPSNPINFDIRVSPKNKSLIQEILFAATDAPPLFAIEWVVYDYDYDVQRFYRTFYTDKKPIALTPAKDSHIYIGPRPDSYVEFPINFPISFSLNADGQQEEQLLFAAFSATGKELSRPIGTVLARDNL